MSHYYNEFDPKAAAWLRELMKAGLIPKGDVDERSIREVKASEVAGYTQCHFFAGIGGWPLALSLAGWPQDRRVWTGSCPCQPFSAAGKRKGAKDPRHLWPWFRHLIFRGRPPVALGEQVASADGRVWLAGVRANLETLGYAVGAADLCAAGVGAPHIRQRLFWVADSTQHGTPDQVREGQSHARRRRHARGMADSKGSGHPTPPPERPQQPAERSANAPAAHCGVGDGRLADAGHGECGRAGECRPDGDDAAERDQETDQSERYRAARWVGDADEPGPQGHRDAGERAGERAAGPAGGAGWTAFDLIPCRDGKARRVEPGTFPLAHGVPARVGRLRGYGNAIVPQVAAEFVKAFMEVE